MDEKILTRENGAEIAKASIESWKSLSDDGRKAIKQNIDVHHGEIGVVAAILGEILSYSENQDMRDAGEFLKGFGKNLVADDIKDIEKWFGLDKLLV